MHIYISAMSRTYVRVSFVTGNCHLQVTGSRQYKYKLRWTLANARTSTSYAELTCRAAAEWEYMLPSHSSRRVLHFRGCVQCAAAASGYINARPLQPN